MGAQTNLTLLTSANTNLTLHYSDVNDGPRRRLFSNWLTVTAVTCPGTITLRWMWGRSFSRKEFTKAACSVSFCTIKIFIFEVLRGSKEIKNKSKTALSTPYVWSSAHVRNWALLHAYWLNRRVWTTPYDLSLWQPNRVWCGSIIVQVS